MNRNKKTESMRAGHKVRKMRMGTTDSKRSRQARARTRARRGAVAVPLALLALALPLATAGPQGAAHAGTGTPTGKAVRLAGANAAPDYLRVVSGGRMVHLPAVCTYEFHVYPLYGGASQQYRHGGRQFSWSTVRGRNLAAYDAVNRDLYTDTRVIVACWEV